MRSPSLALMNGIASFCPMVGNSCAHEPIGIIPNSCFLIQPFDNEKTQRECAINRALNDFYGQGNFKLLKSDSEVNPQGSFCDICIKIKQSQYCIADLSGNIYKIIEGKSINEKITDDKKILLATVKGDIHDIGKNIVKLILENYGYKVIDLGKDVDIENIVETVKKENITLVGLSALMTTTVKNMDFTIQELKKEFPRLKIMVGGAVLNPDYALAINADYYSKDARGAVDIAKKVFSA